MAISSSVREALKKTMSEQIRKNAGAVAEVEEEVKQRAVDTFAAIPEVAMGEHQQMFSELFFDPADIDMPDFPVDTFFHLHADWPESVVKDVPAVIEYQWNKSAAYSYVCNYDKHVQLVGPPGSGKTTLPQQISARIGKPVVIQSFRQGLEEDEWLARTEISNEGTHLRILPVVNSMAYPYDAVMDEFNRMSRGGRLLWNGVLNDQGGLLRLPNGDEVVPVEGWRCVTTDNTKGFGDGLDMFDGDVNDISTTDRFALMIEVPYLPRNQQESILKGLIPDLPDDVTKDIVSFGLKISEAFNDGLLPLPWTPRRASATGTMALRYKNLTKALQDAYVSFMPEDKEKQLCNQLLKDLGISIRHGEFK